MKIILTEDVLAPIKTLEQLALSVVSAVGVFVVIKGVIELSQALPARDSSGITTSILTIAGGIILIAIQIVLNVLGLI